MRSVEEIEAELERMRYKVQSMRDMGASTQGAMLYVCDLLDALEEAKKAGAE